MRRGLPKSPQRARPAGGVPPRALHQHGPVLEEVQARQAEHEGRQHGDHQRDLGSPGGAGPAAGQPLADGPLPVHSHSYQHGAAEDDQEADQSRRQLAQEGRAEGVLVTVDGHLGGKVDHVGQQVAAADG